MLAVLPLAALLAGCFSTDPEAPVEPPEPPTEPFRTFLALGGDLADPVRSLLPVNFVATPTRGPANELTLAVNPQDPGHLVAGGKDYYLGTAHPCPARPDGTPAYPINVWNGVYWSRDAGRTWENALIPGHPGDAANASHPLRQWPCSSDPVVVFGQDGTVYYSGLGIRGDNAPDLGHPCVEGSSSIWLMKSKDGGATWGDFSCVAAGTNFPNVEGPDGLDLNPRRDVDKQWFAVDGESVYFTYMAFRENVGTNATGNQTGPWSIELMFRRSTDGGATWDPEYPLFQFPSLAEPMALRDDIQFSTPQVGPTGVVYVTFRSPADGESWLYFTKSENAGTSFSTPLRAVRIVGLPPNFAEDGYRVDSYPVLAVGPRSGTIYVVWSDYRTGDADVLLTRSLDGGDTWSQPVRVNADPSDVKGSHQFLPWIALGPQEDLHVVWMDSRDSLDPSRLDVYHRVSHDRGDTWEREQRLNERTVETEACHHQSGRNFIGDYLGLAVSHRAVHALWPDGSSGRCDAVTATLLR